MEQNRRNVHYYCNCSVEGCLNSSMNSEVSFFRLPSDLERRTDWLKIIHREDLIDSSCCHARVCEVHFHPDSIMVNARRKLLKKNATPQMDLPLPYHLTEKEVQATVETANASVQCYYDFQTNSSTQTPLHLLKDSPGRAKLLMEIKSRRENFKITNYTQYEANTFLALCGKFLSPNLAREIIEHTKKNLREMGVEVPSGIKTEEPEMSD